NRTQARPAPGARRMSPAASAGTAFMAAGKDSGAETWGAASAPSAAPWHTGQPQPPNLFRAPDVTSEALPTSFWNPEPTEESTHRLAPSDPFAVLPAPSWDPEPTGLGSNPRLILSVR